MSIVIYHFHHVKIKFFYDYFVANFYHESTLNFSIFSLLIDYMICLFFNLLIYFTAMDFNMLNYTCSPGIASFYHYLTPLMDVFYNKISICFFLCSCKWQDPWGFFKLFSLLKYTGNTELFQTFLCILKLRCIYNSKWLLTI